MTDPTYSPYVQGVIEGQAIQSAEFNLIALLKPRISIDGDQWCVLWGENLQDGVAGFGDTAYLAVLDFNKAWHVSANKDTNHDR